ncbi:unnamed protein product [Meloidogyne enterolobii]|uniref:Uncharacterized protein n=1 Tax=Meloidogyne enterolobii TaxID=390850 RepID=A0ACB1AHV4_MELEN
MFLDYSDFSRMFLFFVMFCIFLFSLMFFRKLIFVFLNVFLIFVFHNVLYFCVFRKVVIVLHFVLMFLPLSMFSLNISFVSSSCFTKNVVVVDGNVWQFKLGDCSLITKGILSLLFKL